MDNVSWVGEIVADHTFTVTGTTPQTAFDAAVGTLVDGEANAIDATNAAKLKFRKVNICNRDATLDLWVVFRSRRASSTTNDPSSTRGFVVSPKQSTGWIEISEAVEMRLCNSSGAATASNVFVQAGR